MPVQAFHSPVHLAPHLLAAVEEVHGGLGARLQEVHDHILLQQLHAKVRGRARIVLELFRDSRGFFYLNLFHPNFARMLMDGKKAGASSRNQGPTF